MGSALAALALGVVLAGLLLIRGGVHLQGDNAVAFLDSIFLGPLLAIVGSWLDTKRGQPLGILVLALAVLLALDGMVATYFVGLPLLILVAVSFTSALVRRRQQATAGQ